MNNDGEDVRSFVCELCQKNEAVQGEGLCIECAAATALEEAQNEPIEEDPNAESSQPTRAGDSHYEPHWDRDCGRWLP